MPTIAVLVMILGLILYLLPGPNASWTKVNEIGRIMFMIGLFYVLGALGAHSLRF